MDEWVNETEKATELEDLRCSAQRGKPYGSEAWVSRMAKRGWNQPCDRAGDPDSNKRLPTPLIFLCYHVHGYSDDADFKKYGCMGRLKIAKRVELHDSGIYHRFAFNDRHV